MKKLKVPKPKLNPVKTYEIQTSVNYKPLDKTIFKKITMMDIVYSLHPRQKRLGFFEWLDRYI